MPGGAETCAGDNGGIALPPGFCATVFADNVGHARHMAVAANGVVYVNSWSGRYYVNDTPPPGGFWWPCKIPMAMTDVLALADYVLALSQRKE